MRNMGKAIGIIVAAQVREDLLHDDVNMMGAPSECHDVVTKGEDQRARRAHRHAKSVSGLSRAAFRKELSKVPLPVFDRAARRISANVERRWFGQ